MNSKFRNGLLLGGVVVLTVVALASSESTHPQDFGGSDDQARVVIEALRPDYKPWFAPLWKPPSSEIESSLFALQAAIGAGFVCYALGYWHGRRQKERSVDA